jgi:hypothetical protein
VGAKYSKGHTHYVDGSFARPESQSFSTHAALFGCSQPSSARGTALNSTDPVGNRTCSVPIATATKKSALRSQIRRCPASTPGAAFVRPEDSVRSEQPALLQRLGDQRQ